MTLNTLKGFAYSTKWNATLLAVVIILVFAWQNNNWSMEMLDKVLLIIGGGVGARALEDGLKREKDVIYVDNNQSDEENVE